MFKIALLAFLMGGLVFTGGAAAQKASVVDCNDTSVSASEALDTKEKAESLLSELRSLSDEAQVSEDVVQSAEYHIRRGELAFQTEEYCKAKSHFTSARTQTRAELKRVYRAETTLVLNASASYLNRLSETGYENTEMAVLRERIQRHRADLSEATSLPALRTAHDEANTLRGEVDSLQDPKAVERVNFLYSTTGIAAVGLVLLVWTVIWAVITARLQRWWLNRTDEGEEETGPGLTRGSSRGRTSFDDDD